MERWQAWMRHLLGRDKWYYRQLLSRRSVEGPDKAIRAVGEDLHHGDPGLPRGQPGAKGRRCWVAASLRWLRQRAQERFWDRPLKSDYRALYRKCVPRNQLPGCKCGERTVLSGGDLLLARLHFHQYQQGGHHGLRQCYVWDFMLSFQEDAGGWRSWS